MKSLATIGSEPFSDGGFDFFPLGFGEGVPGPIHLIAEIIGFLALWADAAPRDRAEKLVKTLTDTTKFWRRYGVPTLSAQDPWYSPYVDYCCKWNGPVWLLWDYMVYEGLRDYGYNDLAHELAGKMLNAATVQLKKNHNYWESFSADNEILNSPPNYIWDSIIARLLIEEYQKADKQGK